MGAVMTTQAREMNEQQSKEIEMQELPRLQECQYCQMIVDKDEADGIIERYDQNNNERRYDIKRLKIACQGCEKKNKERIIVEQNQRQSTQQNKKYEYAGQTSRGS